MTINTRIFFKNILIGLIIFYGLFYDSFVMFQMELFGGVKINYIHFRLFLLFLELLYLILVITDGRVKTIFYKIVFPLLVSTFFSTIFGIIEFQSFLIPIGIFTNSVLFIFIIFTLEFDKTKVNLAPFISLIFIYGIINAIFCILQYLTGKLIVPELYLNGNSIYKAVFYYGKMVRSCGLFLSALDVGVLLVFCFVYTLLQFNGASIIKKIGLSALVGLFSFAIFTTRTRNVYLLLLFILLYFVLKRIIINRNVNKIYILLTVLLALVIVLKGENWGNSSEVVTSSASLKIRLEEWRVWKNCFFNRNIIEILFGNCRGQATGIPTDNIYMEYLSSFGIIGMILFLRLFVFILKKINNSINKMSELFLPFIASIFAFGIFNLPNTFFMIYMPMLFVVTINEKDSSMLYDN